MMMKFTLFDTPGKNITSINQLIKTKRAETLRFRLVFKTYISSVLVGVGNDLLKQFLLSANLFWFSVFTSNFAKVFKRKFSVFKFCPVT